MKLSKILIPLHDTLHLAANKIQRSRWSLRPLQDMCSKDMQTCDSCSLIFPRRSMKKMEGPSGEAQFLCRHCAKLLKSKQYCGICKKIWHHSDDGDWVCCNGCNVWVHTECANSPFGLKYGSLQ